MEIPPLPLLVRCFTKENRSAVPELRNIDAELMTGLQHRERLHAGRECIPAK